VFVYERFIIKTFLFNCQYLDVGGMFDSRNLRHVGQHVADECRVTDRVYGGSPTYVRDSRNGPEYIGLYIFFLHFIYWGRMRTDGRVWNRVYIILNFFEGLQYGFATTVDRTAIILLSINSSIVAMRIYPLSLSHSVNLS